MQMLAEHSASPVLIGEKDLRRQIDRSVSRALVDDEFARLLLTDPTVALEDSGCAPRQYRLLRSIRATDLVDFARQARALFWIVESQSSPQQDELQLAAAAT